MQHPSDQRRSSLTPLPAVLVALLLGCSDSSGLAGHFVLQSADGFQPVVGSSVHLIFEGDKLSVSGGCNSLGGEYGIEGGRLAVEGLSSTNRGCDAALLAQDQQLGSFLSARPRLTRSGDQLTLSSDEGMVLRFLDREVADPDRPLVDTEWVIDTLIDERSFGSSPTSANPLVQFARDGSVNIRSTCNVGVGRYMVDADRLTLTNLVYSEEGCGVAADAGLEQRVKAVLHSGTLTFEIEARRLTLMRDNVGLGAQAQMAQAGGATGGP
jgi:heat shock protein HslJ